MKYEAISVEICDLDSFVKDGLKIHSYEGRDCKSRPTSARLLRTSKNDDAAHQYQFNGLPKFA